MKFTLTFALYLFFASSSAILQKYRLHANVHPASVFIPSSPPIKSPVSHIRQIVQSPPIQTSGEVQVPVISTHDVQVVPVHIDAPVQRAQVISVEPSGQLVHLVFKSVSSPLSIQQQHTPSERIYYETTRSEEQPHIIRHEVFKPVVQELRETIQPYRQVVQEIKPVIEKVNILLPKGQQIFQQQPQQHLEQTRLFPSLPFPKLPKSPKFPHITKPKIVQQIQQTYPEQSINVPIEQQQFDEQNNEDNFEK